MPPTILPRRLPALWPYLLVCAVTAVLVCLGSRFHARHHSDSLTPILVSLQRWTFFMWDQDRIGMLVPLLAVPFRDPLANLLFQDALYIFAGLAAFFLLPRYLLRDETYPLAGALSTVAFLGLAPKTWCHDFTCNTFYGLWLALGLGGLVLAEQRPDRRASWPRLLAALLLLVLAHWVYSAAVLVLGPLVLGRFLLCRRTPAETVSDSGVSDGRSLAHVSGWLLLLRAEVTNALLLVGTAFAIGYGLMCLPGAECPTNLRSLPAAEWPAAWWRLAYNQCGWVAPFPWPGFLLAAAVVGVCCLRETAARQRQGRAWRVAAVLAVAAAAFFFFMGTRQWVVISRCHPRYTYPAVFLLQGAPAVLAVAALGEVRARLLYVLAALALPVAALGHYQFPSVQQVRSDLDSALGACTADVLAARCTHVAGDYWFAWPVVFHTNLVLHERHEQRTVWGIAPRAGATHRRWQDMPREELRVAIPADGLAEAVPFLAWLRLPPMEVVEKRETIWVLCPRAGAERY